MAHHEPILVCHLDIFLRWGYSSLVLLSQDAEDHIFKPQDRLEVEVHLRLTVVKFGESERTFYSPNSVSFLLSVSPNI